MKKITQILLAIAFIFMCLFTTVYATSNEKSQDTLKEEQSTTKLLEIKKNQMANIEDYTIKYGSDTYGVTAYVLDIVRIYSIPCVFLGVAFSAVYQYVIGLKRLDVRDKGFNSMIAIITIGVICQILPIIFAIVVTRDGN